MRQTAFGPRLLPDIRKTGWSIFAQRDIFGFDVLGQVWRTGHFAVSRLFFLFMRHFLLVPGFCFRLLQLLAPSVDGGVFRGTAEEVSVEGVFNDFSGIVLVRKNQIGDFKVKRSAVLAFQPAQLEGHGFVGKDQLAGPAVAYF